MKTRGQNMLGMALALILVAAAPAWAGPADNPPVRVLTLDLALTLALEQNKDIQKAKEYRNKVQGRYVEERAAALPQLTAKAGYYRDRDESQAALYGGSLPLQRQHKEANLTLNQVIFTWGQVSAAIRAAEVGLATAEDQLRLFRQAALRDVSAAFHDILLARESDLIARENLEQKERHLDEARRRFAAGLATDYDVLAAEVALANARPDAIRACNALAITRERLGFLLGLDGRRLEVEGTLACDLGPDPAYEPALDVALARRPEMEDLVHRRRIAKEVVTVYQAGNKPRLDMQVQYGWGDLESGRNQEQGMSGMAGFFLTWPLFDGLRTQGRVAQARSDEATLTIEEAKLKDAIALEVSQSIKAVVENGEIVRGLSGTVTQARRLLFMAEKGFEHGVKTRLEVDDAQFNLKQAKGNLARARRDYLVARVNLAWTMGVLGEPAQTPLAQTSYLQPGDNTAN